MVSINVKKKLETALRRALKLALIEMDCVEDGFSEESLRYLVMSEISKKKIWGTFPNKPGGKTKLLFEQEYNILKFKKKTFKPDIVSKKGEEHLLAIELKIKSDVSDIDKCKEYINDNKGFVSFELAASVYATPQPYTQVAHLLENRIKYAKKIRKNIKNARLLVAYIEWEPKYYGIKNDSKKNRIRLEWIY
ncbi:MAG: hypothetical protein ACK5BV_03390 [Bacteroidota bacterium]